MAPPIRLENALRVFAQVLYSGDCLKSFDIREITKEAGPNFLRRRVDVQS